MAGPTNSLTETIASLCEALGIVDWLYEPAQFGSAIMLRMTFACSVCGKRWRLWSDASGPNAREAVIAELFESHAGHVCNLELGPAGRSEVAC